MNSPYDNTGTCMGDSGGPLLTSDSTGEPVEIGITSVGPADCNTVTADYFTAILPLSSWAAGVIQSVAPVPPPPPPTTTTTTATTTTTPPPTTATTTTPSPPQPKPRLPSMTRAAARSYVRQTVAGVLRRPFNHKHQYRTSCARKSSIRYSCKFSFRSGANDYWGTVNVWFVLGWNTRVDWTDGYTMRWVNDRCYCHSKHRSRCRIYRKSGSW